MKRLIAATAIAAATLVANPVLANDVTSVIPAAQLGSNAPATANAGVDTAASFGSVDVISVIPGAAPTGSSATVANQVLASKASGIGNEDVSSTFQ